LYLFFHLFPVTSSCSPFISYKTASSLYVNINSYQILLISDLINNIISLLDNDRVLHSSTTLPIFNMFKTFDKIFTDEYTKKLMRIFTEVSDVFSSNSWTKSGFNTSPNHKLLASNLRKILNNFQ